VSPVGPATTAGRLDAVLRARDCERLLWNVRRGRSVFFLGLEPGGRFEAAAEPHASLVALSFPFCVTTCHNIRVKQALRAIPDERLLVGRYDFRGPNPPRSFAGPLPLPPWPPPRPGGDLTDVGVVRPRIQTRQSTDTREGAYRWE
jgi:hypothetical protein